MAIDATMRVALCVLNARVRGDDVNKKCLT